MNVAFRTGHRNIQPSFATRAVQRAKIMQQPPLSINTIGNTKNDRIALIALYRLKILDKERLIPIILKEKLFVGGKLPAS